MAINFFRATVIDAPVPSGMPRDEVKEFIASPQAAKRLLTRPSRREMLSGIALTSTVFLFNDQVARAQAAQLARAALSNPELRKLAWDVGVWLAGKFFATNNDSSKSQDGNTSLILYGASDRVEGSKYILIRVPRDSTIIVPFNNGPPARSAGPKTLEISSSINSVSAEFSAI